MQVGTFTGGFVLRPEEGEVRHLRPPGRSGSVTLKVDPVNTGSKHLALGTQELIPGGRIPTHLHECQEEILVVQSGRGTAILGDERFPVEPGSTVYIPSQVWHGIENTSDEPLMLLWVITPPGLEEMFRVIGTLPGATPEPLTAEEFAALVPRFDMRVRET